MYRLNIAVTTALVLCLAGVLVGIALHQPQLIAICTVLGTLLTICAGTITLVLAAVILSRIPSGTARPLLAKSWLGLVNGIVAVAGVMLFVWGYGS